VLVAALARDGISHGLEFPVTSHREAVRGTLAVCEDMNVLQILSGLLKAATLLAALPASADVTASIATTIPGAPCSRAIYQFAPGGHCL
jgi:hypothetical protein